MIDVLEVLDLRQAELVDRMKNASYYFSQNRYKAAHDGYLFVRRELVDRTLLSGYYADSDPRSSLMLMGEISDAVNGMLSEPGDLILSEMQFQIGRAYVEGLYHIPANRNEGIHWLQSAADNGNPYARHVLDQPVEQSQGKAEDPLLVDNPGNPLTRMKGLIGVPTAEPQGADLRSLKKRGNPPAGGSAYPIQ